jgi:hypothetical protein
MSFHLWCSSNRIMEDSIHLQLFQRTLTSTTTKWYVDKNSGAHSIFESLAKSFLSFFQLPIHHDTRSKILSGCKQNITTHISNHIHEWHRRHNLCKLDTTPQQRIDWFLQSLVPTLSEDVAINLPQTKDELITKEQ